MTSPSVLPDPSRSEPGGEPDEPTEEIVIEIEIADLVGCVDSAGSGACSDVAA